MTQDEYDLVVVGAGPSGVMAAKSAAEDGASVLVLDRRKELGVPVHCGEALHAGVLEDLEISLDSEIISSMVDKSEVFPPSGDSVVLESSSDVNYILDRERFDRHLSVLAGREGAEIWPWTYVDDLLFEDGKVAGVSCRGRRGEAEISADVVIAADGIMSRAARWAGFETGFGSKNTFSGAQFEIAGLKGNIPDGMEFYFGQDLAPGGYGWVFPKGENTVNVGLGVMASRADKDVLKYLESFVSDRLGFSDGEIIEINSTAVPACGTLDKTYSDSFLIVGDAARQGNALTGGGTGWDMRAGDIAGRAAAEAVSERDTSEDFLSEYQELWEDEIGDQLEGYHRGKDVLFELEDDDLKQIIDSLKDEDSEGISLTKLLPYFSDFK